MTPFEIGFLMFALDQATKLAARIALPYNHGIVASIDGFLIGLANVNHSGSLMLSSNTATSIAACVAAVVYFACTLETWIEISPLGISLILAGCFGNGTDLLFHGTVTDFIFMGSARSNAVFNVADLCTTIGVCMIAGAALAGKKEKCRLWSR